MESEKIKKSRCLEQSLMLIDSSGYGSEAHEDKAIEENDEPESKKNSFEAKLICKHIEILLMHGIKPIDIAIISPYRAQIQLLRELINNHKIEIGTVDGFQGREKEAIIISMVRSNDTNTIGFLKEDRRTNVAVTRARRHCAIFVMFILFFVFFFYVLFCIVCVCFLFCFCFCFCFCKVRVCS